MFFLLCILGIALKAACLFYVYAVCTTLAGYQDVLTFTFFQLKILIVFFYHLNGCVQFNEWMAFMGILHPNVQGYIFKV